jgi:hypothetical protein
LLPTADSYLGMKYVEHQCAKDGGLTVFRVVENVDGVMGLAPDRATLEHTGFRFIELDRPSADPSRAYRRIERLPNGEIAESFASKAEAKYETRRATVWRHSLSVDFGYGDYVVVVRDTGEALVRYRVYRGGAGWALRFLGQFLDAGGVKAVTCPPFVQQVEYLGDALVLAALKPIKP